jgi:hypothetical protein
VGRQLAYVLRRMNRTFVLLLAVAVLFSSCRKPLPSPDYIEASNHYTSLLALHGDDAFASSEMTEVLAQLGRVPEKSSDHAAAVALTATISAERTRIASAAAKAAIVVSPQANPVFPSFAPVAVPEEAAVAADSKPAAAEFSRGADFEALQRKYVGCMVSRGAIKMIGPDGGQSDTEGFDLHDSVSCRSRMPRFGADNVLVVQSGKVVYLLPKSSFKSVTTLEDGGSVPEP